MAKKMTINIEIDKKFKQLSKKHHPGHKETLRHSRKSTSHINSKKGTGIVPIL